MRRTAGHRELFRDGLAVNWKGMAAAIVSSCGLWVAIIVAYHIFM